MSGDLPDARPGARTDDGRHHQPQRRDRDGHVCHSPQERLAVAGREEVGARSKAVADSDFPTDIRWIRSYLIVEDDGTLGSVCIYQASSPEAVRAHAHRVGMPADEISPAATTVVIRPDPEQQPVGS